MSIITSSSGAQPSGAALDYDAIRARYQAIRARSQPLNSRLVKLLIPHRAFRDIARQIGVMGSDGVLRFNDETQVAVLNDCLIYEGKHQDMPLLRWLQKRKDLTFSAEEREILGMMSRAHYTLFVVTKLVPGTGIFVDDAFELKRNVFVADINLSRCNCEGEIFAGRLVPAGDFYYSTGAAIPVEPENMETIQSIIMSYAMADNKARIADLPRVKLSEMTIRIIRYLLSEQNTEWVKYEDIVVE